MEVSPVGNVLCKYLKVIAFWSGPKVIKLFLCSTQLSTKFQLLIKIKMLINVKMLKNYEQDKFRAQLS